MNSTQKIKKGQLSGVVAYLMKNFFTSETIPQLKEAEYTQQQNLAVAECVNILDSVDLELVGTRPKDR